MSELGAFYLPSGLSLGDILDGATYDDIDLQVKDLEFLALHLAGFLLGAIDVDLVGG